MEALDKAKLAKIARQYTEKAIGTTFELTKDPNNFAVNVKFFYEGMLHILNQQQATSNNLIDEFKQWHHLAYPNAAEAVFDNKLTQFVNNILNTYKNEQ